MQENASSIVQNAKINSPFSTNIDDTRLKLTSSNPQSIDYPIRALVVPFAATGWYVVAVNVVASAATTKAHTTDSGIYFQIHYNRFRPTLTPKEQKNDMLEAEKNVRRVDRRENNTCRPNFKEGKIF